MLKPISPTALITGTTDGIGYDTARRLVIGGWNVILHTPTHISGEETVDRLVKDGADPLRLESVVADFARFEEVRAMAAQVIAIRPHIDVLINNAAVAGPESRTLTADGNELTFQINYLAPYLLTRLLTTLLNTSSVGRVVNVSSTLHRTANFDWADLQREHRYAPVAAYAQSKLTLSMFTAALTTFSEHRFTAVSVHPGVVQTALLPMYSRTGAPVGEAGAAVAHLASPETEVINGAYYEGDAITLPASLVGNPRAVARLWKISGRLTGLEQPVVSQMI